MHLCFRCHTGTAPNIARNAIVNCTELVTYDFIKDMLLRSTQLTGKTQWLHSNITHVYDIALSPGFCALHR